MAVAAAVPKDILLVIDNSGSMLSHDPQFLVRMAVNLFINKLDENSRAGLLIFDQGARLVVPLTAVDAEGRVILANALEGINYRGQWTDSPVAIDRAIYELKTNGRDGTDKIIVFMSDGDVDTGNAEADVVQAKWLLEELSVDAANNGIKIFSVAFTEQADIFLIQSLAKTTGGDFVRAPLPADLVGAFDAAYAKLFAPRAAPPAVATPLPDETVKLDPIVEAVSPEALLATLTAAERQELEEIAAQTGIPIEQLALELIGPESEASAGSADPAELLATLTPEERRALEEMAAQTGIPIEQLASELVGAESDAATSTADPAELLASLTVEERQELEVIAEQTGFSIEQLAMELIAPQLAAGADSAEPGGVIVSVPDDELTLAEERTGFIILVVAAVLLLGLTGFIVWFVMRRRKAAPLAATDVAAFQADEPAMPEAFIKDIHGYSDESTIQLGQKPLMVGRVAGTDTQHLDYLVVNKGTVGRRHAIIKYKDFSFWIVDQGSVNGTFVNGERISGERQLKHGDMLRFHKYEVEFSQPDMDDGFHTVFADPDLADATIVASAATMAATTGAVLDRDRAAQDDFDMGTDADAQPAPAALGDGDDLFAADEGDTRAVDSDNGDSAAAFAEPDGDGGDIFDVTGVNPMPVESMASPGDTDVRAVATDDDVFDITGVSQMPTVGAASPSDTDAGDETIDENSTAIFDAPPAIDIPAEDTDVIGKSEDDENFGVEINLDVVAGTNSQDPSPSEDVDFDAEASAFFEDITVGPTPDDMADPIADPTVVDGAGDATSDSNDDMFDLTGEQSSGQAALDAQLERATAILDGPAIQTKPDDTAEMETIERDDLPTSDNAEDPTMDAFVKTDSFDAPATIPPAMPPATGDDVTLDAFISTSMFEAGKVKLTNEDATMLPEQVPDDPKNKSDNNAGDTVIIDGRTPKDDDDAKGAHSEDPTVVK